MSPQPFVSVRKSIKWGDKPAFENTDTLVLTTASKHFVDIRLFRDTLAQPAVKAEERLEWAFAGTASSTPATNTKPSHTVWTHWVDNKTTDEVRDEGDMYPQEGTNEVLEKGAMVNPASGVVEDYEEVWIDLDLDAQGVCWVIKTENEGIRGMMARIGGYIQAVLRNGREISVGRWNLNESGKWETMALFGTGTQGDKLAMDAFRVREDVLKKEESLSVGDNFEFGDLRTGWECVEVSRWG